MGCKLMLMPTLAFLWAELLNPNCYEAGSKHPCVAGVENKQITTSKSSADTRADRTLLRRERGRVRAWTGGQGSVE